MSQDYSRINFDPGDDYLGVLLQQGRPLTDADWNALVLQLNRRTQAGSLDTFGPAVVPEQTEDGFLIAPVAGGFTIGRGRIYVDGLLAENHGAGPRTWDPHLAEEFRPNPLPWNAQPYLPVPDTIPAFPYLVYVDVWQREVTELSEKFPTGHPEARRLIDAAIGVDTTQRLQTVWQVRTLGVGAGTDCGTPLDTIAAWTERTAPSAGRLTTATGIVPTEPDPCLVPPLGGYKGAENQLYRVEIQTGGAPGTATFKWSRDNASVQARVVTIPDGTHLVLDSVGKDDVLRFKAGDWIEVTDDFRELMGQPGILCRIAPGPTGVSDSTRTLTLTAATAIPAGTFPVDLQFHPIDTRNTRVRKWDQSGIVKFADGTTHVDVDTTNGEIVIPAAGTLLIENGILVTFSLSPAGGQFHAGDWWVFAARTNGATVEILDAAPPRGTHHHYAKLAVVTGPTDADDCREHWPPDRGCCTKVVRPGQSIQNAIDSLPPSGGCVCLKTGLHEIDAPIRIENSNIILHGEAPGVRVVTTRQMQFMLIVNNPDGVENVEVMHVAFEYAQAPDEFDGAGIIATFNCRRVRIHDCLLTYTNELTNIGIGGVAVSDATECAICECTIGRVTAGVLVGGTTSDLTIAGNVMNGLVALDDGTPFPYSFFGVRLSNGTEAAVRDNRITDFRIGVQAFGVRADVSGNVIRRLRFPDALDDAGSPAELFYAIDVHGTLHSRVHGNDIEMNSLSYGGIRVAGRYDDVTRNKIVSTYGQASVVGPIGVYVGDFNVDPTGAGDFATLAHNQIAGPQVAISIRNPQGVRVSDNLITGIERLLFGVVMENCVECVIADNTLHDLTLGFVLTGGQRNRVLDNTATTLRVAAWITDELGLEFTGNSFDDVSLLGIAGINLRRGARFAGVRLANCAYEAANSAVGIGLLATNPLTVTDIAIEDCDITDVGLSPDGAQQTAGIAWGVVSGLVSHLKIADNRIGQTLNTQLEPAREHRAVLLVGVPNLSIVLADRLFEFGYGTAFMTGNSFQGPGLQHLVEVARLPINDLIDIRFEQVTFLGNRCDHTSPGGDRVVTVDLYGTHMIVNGNQVKTPFGGHSFGFNGRNNVAVVGNSSTGDYVNLGTTLPTPHTNFNVIFF